MVICQSTSKGEDNLVKCAELLIEAGGDVNDHDKYVYLKYFKYNLPLTTQQKAVLKNFTQLHNLNKPCWFFK